MSGTSLDGLDLAYCQFNFSKEWSFNIIQTKAIPFDETWQKRLQHVLNTDPLTLWKTHTYYGHLIAKEINQFIDEASLKAIDAIAMHGQTLYHNPQENISIQIGSGAAVAALTGYTTICDFRSVDIGLGGQGAPLVPVGDRLLFNQYGMCLNLGGIANISIQEIERQIAYDICGCNAYLNYYAAQLNKAYDEDGIIARSGKVDQELLSALNQLYYYKLSPPKSLDAGQVLEDLLQLDLHHLSAEDMLATLTEHIAQKISDDILLEGKNAVNNQLLLTGGGTFNTFLIERFKYYLNDKISLVIPNEELIAFKEAIIFGFLGALRLEEQANCHKDITGARINNVGGAVYLGHRNL